MLRSEQNPPRNNRTSAAKAVHAQEDYGTAEAVPFVQRLARRKPDLDKSEVEDPAVAGSGYFPTTTSWPRNSG